MHPFSKSLQPDIERRDAKLNFETTFMKVSSFLTMGVLFTCVTLAKAGLVVGPRRPSGRPTVHPQHFRVPILGNL